MPFRFRKTINLGSGLKFNLGGKSASLRLGGRGFGITGGTSGLRVSGGIPGTGLSYTKKLTGKGATAGGAGRLLMWVVGLAFLAGLGWWLFSHMGS